MTEPLRIGIDFGGTKISGIVFNADDEVLAHEHRATPKGDYDGVIHCIRDLVSQFENRFGAASVGIGMPGSISPKTQNVQNSNSTWMNGRDLQRDIDRALDRTVRLANDANCFALSEAIDGAARDARTVFGVILGTGCGGGIVVEKSLLVGPHNIAGEWGHTPLPWSGPAEYPGQTCWCGRTGCMETWVSGSGLQQDFFRTTGNKLTGEEISDAAQSGNAQAAASLDRLADRLARGLAVVVNVVDPDVIVLGGGLSNLPQLYGKVAERMSPYVFADACEIDIRPPLHGDDSGVRGAARL